MQPLKAAVPYHAAKCNQMQVARYDPDTKCMD